MINYGAIEQFLQSLSWRSACEWSERTPKQQERKWCWWWCIRIFVFFFCSQPHWICMWMHLAQLDASAKTFRTYFVFSKAKQKMRTNWIELAHQNIDICWNALFCCVVFSLRSVLNYFILGYIHIFFQVHLYVLCVCFFSSWLVGRYFWPLVRNIDHRKKILIDTFYQCMMCAR